MDVMQKIMHRSSKVFPRQCMNRCKKLLLGFIPLRICCLEFPQFADLSVSQSSNLRNGLNYVSPKLMRVSLPLFFFLVVTSAAQVSVLISHFIRSTQLYHLSAILSRFPIRDRVASFSSAAVSFHTILPRRLKMSS
jgi:hypothetical protein